MREPVLVLQDDGDDGGGGTRDDGTEDVKAFTAAVFGGIGSIPGAMLGGILLGLIEQMSKTYISTLWADAIVFAVLVVVLVVKPTGLLGKPMQEKV